MRAKKYRVGGMAPDGMQQDPNSTGARKAPRQRQEDAAAMAQANMAAIPPDTTFRDPEHGAKAVPLSDDVQRKPTGTTAMGDPYTGDESFGYTPGTPGAAISIGGTQINPNDIMIGGINVDLGGGTIPTDVQSGDLLDDLSGQNGEQGMMINAAKGAMVPHDPMGGFADGADMPGEPSKGYERPKPSRKPKFEEGGFNVMDPRDFLTMLRDERQAKNAQRKAPGPRKNK